MIPLVANMLVKIGCPDDAVLFNASVGAILPVVDQLLILDTSEPDKRMFFPSDYPKVRVLEETPDFCAREGFAAARNILLEASPPECFILWVDSDEVHFPEQLQQIKNLLQAGNYDDVKMHFVHFCLGSNAYEKFEARTTIFRRAPETHWQNKVHEQICHGADQHAAPTRRTFYSDYVYHHYGYVRDQAFVFSRWHQYAQLEGQADPYVVEADEAGQTVPYFRGERSGPDKILEDRRRILLPYFGEYPGTLPRDWVASKHIDI